MRIDIAEAGDCMILSNLKVWRQRRADQIALRVNVHPGGCISRPRSRVITKKQFEMLERATEREEIGQMKAWPIPHQFLQGFVCDNASQAMSNDGESITVGGSAQCILQFL